MDAAQIEHQIASATPTINHYYNRSRISGSLPLPQPHLLVAFLNQPITLIQDKHLAFDAVVDYLSQMLT